MDTPHEPIYGETKKKDAAYYIVSMVYKKPKYSVLFGVFNPFNERYTRGEENLSNLVNSKTITGTDNMRRMVFAKFTLNIDFGNKDNKGSKGRRLNHSSMDVEPSIISGGKK